MRDSRQNLRSLFPDAGRVPPSDEGGRTQRLEDRLGADFNGLKWPSKMPELVSNFPKLLDVNLTDLLISTWQKSDEILEALAASRDGPDSEVHLLDYSTELTLEPYIEVRIASLLQATRITLTVDLTLSLKAVVLTASQGRITGISAGNCEVGGTVTYRGLKLASLDKTVVIPLATATSRDDD